MDLPKDPQELAKLILDESSESFAPYTSEIKLEQVHQFGAGLEILRGQGPLFSRSNDSEAVAIQCVYEQISFLLSYDARSKLVDLAAPHGFSNQIPVGDKSARWVGGSAFVRVMPSAKADIYPVRFNRFDPLAGLPLALAPEVLIETPNGIAARFNPGWLKAKFELIFAFTGPTLARRSIALDSPLKIKVMDEEGTPYFRHYYQFEREYRVIGDGVRAYVYEREL